MGVIVWPLMVGMALTMFARPWAIWLPPLALAAGLVWHRINGATGQETWSIFMFSAIFLLPSFIVGLLVGALLRRLLGDARS